MAMKRRDFLKAMSATGVAAAAGPMFIVDRADAADKLDLGMVRSVKVDVISETSWFDNDKFKANMTEGGGASTSQYTIAWDPENAGGYSALVTVTTLQGEEKRILLDSGWSNAWMDYVFEKKGIPRMLQRGEIDFMVLSHWHLDHLWGIESTLKHNPNIKIIAPKTYYPEDLALLREKGRFTAKDKAGREVVLAKNDVPHKGELVLTGPEGQDNAGLYKLMPGVAVKMFDVPILLRVRGENVLYFNVKDKGTVTVTGCCHPGILSLFSFAKQNFAGYQPYGAYGGLHLSLFETWDPEVRRRHRRREGVQAPEGRGEPLHGLALGGEGGRERRPHREGDGHVQDVQAPVPRRPREQRVPDQRRLGGVLERSRGRASSAARPPGGRNVERDHGDRRGGAGAGRRAGGTAPRSAEPRRNVRRHLGAVAAGPPPERRPQALHADVRLLARDRARRGPRGDGARRRGVAVSRLATRTPPCAASSRRRSRWPSPRSSCTGSSGGSSGASA